MTRLRTALTTRAAHQELTEMCHALITPGIPCLALFGEAADTYLYKLLAIDADWIINADEDAFIWDSDALFELVDYMNENGYVACGMPDGAAIDIIRWFLTHFSMCFIPPHSGRDSVRIRF